DLIDLNLTRVPNRSITRQPGPEPHFLIGNFPLGMPYPLAVFSGWAREFGDIFYYRVGWIHVYFLNSPELIESVLVTNQQNFRKDRVIQNSRWFLGQGLLTSEGGEWLRQRRLSQPAFHRERLALYARIVNACAEEMLSSGTIPDVGLRNYAAPAALCIFSVRRGTALLCGCIFCDDGSYVTASRNRAEISFAHGSRT